MLLISKLFFLNVLHEITDFCFQGVTRSKILVNEYGATWKAGKNTKGIKFFIYIKQNF